MTAENWVTQVNIKVPVVPNDNYRDALVNLRADTAEQMELVLAWAENHAADIARLAQTFAASGNVVAAFPGAGTGNVQVQPEPAQQGWAQQPPPAQTAPQWAQPQQAPQQQAGPGPMCAHGPMQFREGVGKSSGKPYKAWFCSSRDRASQCDPQFVRG